MSFRERTCQECGTVFIPRDVRALFCSTGCKQDFNTRRRNRGAELYDFVMGEGPKSETVAKLIAAYKAADKAKRAGRPSHQNVRVALLRLPHAYGKDGDGR